MVFECAETWGRHFLASHAEKCNLPSVYSSLTAEPPTPISYAASPADLADCPLPNYKPRTPIHVDRFAAALESHPNQALVAWAVACLRHGARLGYTGERRSVLHRNHGSATRFASALADDIRGGLQSGRLVALSSLPKRVWVSPLGVVPKPRSDKFRTITNFAYPDNDSINDRIVCAPTHYDRLDSLLPWLRAYGTRAFVAGVDIADAFRIIPVHASDLWLHALSFEGKFYIDTSLVFGCKSSPVIFNTIASLLAWIVYTQRQMHCILHYLDDFITVAPDRPSAVRDDAALRATFSLLGVPLKTSKCYSPCQMATHLGFRIDTIRGRVSFLPTKIEDILSVMSRIMAKPLRNKETTHLIGWLLHACSVSPRLRPCITILQWLERDGDADIPTDFPLAMAFAEDILKSHPFVDIYRSATWRSSDDTVTLFTDATPVRGGYWCPFLNLFATFPLPQLATIHLSEAYALYTAIFHTGPLLRHRSLAVFVDNNALFHAFRHGASRDPPLNRFILLIFRLLFRFDIDVHLFWIPSEENIEADLLSRNKLEWLLARHPTAVIDRPGLPPFQ